MSASRVRLASSSGADFTSSRSCRIIPPMRITLAGCSTNSVMFRSPSASPSARSSSASEAWSAALVVPSGPMIITRGSSPSCGAGSAFWDVMASTLRSEDDLPDVVTGLHDSVRLRDLLKRQAGMHQRLDRAVGDERPDILDRRGADRRLLLRRASPQRRGDHSSSLAHQYAEIDLTLGPTLHPDHHEPSFDGERVEVAGQVLGAHVVEDDVGAAAVRRRANLLDEVLFAIVHGNVGAQRPAHV